MIWDKLFDLFACLLKFVGGAPDLDEPRLLFIGSRVYREERGVMSTQNKSQVNNGACLGCSFKPQS